MRKLVVFALLAAVAVATGDILRATSFTLETDDEDGHVHRKEVAFGADGVPVADGAPEPSPNAAAPVVIDAIVNVGKFLWDVVKENKASVDYDEDWASATPKNADWLDLEGFVDKDSKLYKWTVKGPLGTEVARFGWKFSYQCKGSYNGKGKYIDVAGVSINNIYAGVGWKVNVNVSVPSKPTNKGTKKAPIASLPIEVGLRASSIIQSYVLKCRVIVDGECGLKISTCNGY